MSESKKRPVNIGIIGVGQIGKSHLRRYTEIEDANIVALADINEAEGQRVAKEFGIPNAFTDYRDLLAMEEIEAVDVCLHNNLHAPFTIAALEAGKNVYCEKPMAGAYIDALSMYEKAKETGKMLHIQLSRIYSIESKAAKRLIETGEVGNVYHARSTGYRRRGRPFVDGYGTAEFVRKHRSGGGALYDMGVYHISQMLYLLDNPKVVRVSGKTYQETAMNEARREESGYSVEELGLGFVRFENNVTMDVIEAWAVHLDPFAGSSLLGSKGGIRLEPFGFYNILSEDLSASSQIDLNHFEFRLKQLYPNYEAYQDSQRHWIAANQGIVDLLPTAELALNTMLISEGIYLSNALGREVTADEVREQSVSTAIKLD